jgi:phosphohistidine phosphatase
MDLYLVRHAIAEDHSATGDADRALTPEGKAKMAQATRGLRKLKLRPDLILTSPLRRARETAEILAQGLDEPKVEVMRELSPAAAVASVIPALRPHARRPSLALVGHEPNLGHLASLLLAGTESRFALEFKKGGVACIAAELSGEGVRGAVLRWLVTPKFLRSL